MYDFIKAELYGIDVGSLTDKLKFYTPVDTHTGDMKAYSVAKEDGLKFKLINGVHLHLEGSSHKNYNGGKHNHNDFTVADFEQRLNEWSGKYGISPAQSQLHNLEFGANVSLPLSAKSFLESIVSYRNRQYDRRSFYAGSLLTFPLQQYTIKIYDKGKQYSVADNLVRFEIKVTRMEYLKSRGIAVRTLADLINPAIIARLAALLKETFSSILFYDPSIDLASLKHRDALLLSEGRRPTFWTENQKSNPENTKKKRLRFNRLVQQYATINYREIGYKALASKLDQITRSTDNNSNTTANVSFPVSNILFERLDKG